MTALFDMCRWRTDDLLRLLGGALEVHVKESRHSSTERS